MADVPDEMLSSRHAARLVLVAALVVGLVPAAGAAGNGSGSFVDDDRSKYEAYIETARAAGLVSGCNPPGNDRFCPHRTVRRGEMAVMLVRALKLPRSTTDYFADDNGHVAEAAINSLAAAGATKGCGEGRFCPERSLTRGEMASLFAGALGWELPANTFPYADLDDSPYGLSTKSLARRGGLDPCNAPSDTKLCPDRTVTRDEAAYSLTSVLGLGTAAPAVDGGSGPTLGFEEAFEALDLWDGRRPGARNRVGLTDSGYRGSGLRVTIPKGSHFGADFKLDLSSIVGEEPEQLFFRYFLRLDPDWAPRISGKLPGFSGVYGQSGKGGFQSTPSAPGWSARMEFFGTKEGDPRARLGYYVYHLGQEGRYGDGMSWNEAGMLVPGDWYCVEGEVTLNRPGLQDGALRAWVDGTPVFNAAGIEFRRPDEPDIRIESFWFNVYYGGKPKAERDFGMVVDEVVVDSARVGCGSGDGLERTLDADFTGDGFEDVLTWGECPGGTCFQGTSVTSSGESPIRRLGDGAWFSLDTSRVGMAAADLNGDGRDDVVYPGRCAGSDRCWRVHLSEGSVLGTPQDWGTGARFAPETRSLISGDWNGDGFDDLAYLGLCDSDAARCWRAHVNDHGQFIAADFGGFPDLADGVEVSVADLDGDGRDDLLFPAPCLARTCWFGQFSNGEVFASPVNLGMARPEELELKELFDFDEDGDDDMLTVSRDEAGYVVATRRAGPDGLGDVTGLDSVTDPVVGIEMRRTGPGRPVEALITTTCDEAPCVETRLSLGGRLLAVPEFDEAVAPPPPSFIGFVPR